MTDFDEILGAFEEALELERELGTRTVECDRALLVPMRPAPPPAPRAPEAGAQPNRAEVAGAQPNRAGVAGAQSNRAGVAAPAKPVVPAPPAAPARPGARVDFAFIPLEMPAGAAADLLEKMVAAMGYAMSAVTVVAAGTAVKAPPAARVYVVLGSDAFRVFAPGQRAALGLWTEVAGVHTVVTSSPARILSYFGNDAEGLRKAKLQIWADLKSALARVGKKPPAPKR